LGAKEGENLEGKKTKQLNEHSYLCKLWKYHQRWDYWAH